MFSNLEVVIGAYFMEDRELIKTVESGANFHDVNTKIFFQIEEDDPRWKAMRKVAKIIVFARLDTMTSLNSVNSWKAEMPIMSQAS